MTAREKAALKWIGDQAGIVPKRYLIEIASAGRKFLILPGLEQHGHFPLGFCSQEAAEWCLQEFPGEYFVVDELEVAELERVYALQ